MDKLTIDARTAGAAQAFLHRIAGRYDIAEAILFGSRARHDHRPDSDADIAIVIRGRHERRVPIALDMAGVAFDVLLDTGVLVEPFPIWQEEIEHPERFDDPALISAIRRDGIRL